MSEQQIQALRSQNDRLIQQLSLQQIEYQKLSKKYQKALKQLAPVIKANLSLKKDYDQLYANQEKIIEEKCQAHKAKMKQYLKKQLDQLNEQIGKLSMDKQKLQIQKNALTIKVNSLEIDKSKIQKEKQQITRKYQIIKREIDSMNPQTGINNCSQHIKQLKKKTTLIDYLQSAIANLQKQKHQIQQQYKKKVQEVQRMWQQWHQFQRVNYLTKFQNQVNLKFPTHEFEKKRAQTKQKLQKQNGKLSKNNIRLNDASNSKFISSSNFQEIQNLKSKIQGLEKENKDLRAQKDIKTQNQKLLSQLKETNIKLAEQKMLLQNVIQQQKIKMLSPNLKSTSQAQKNDEDLISILKDLHEQLSPLRKEITSLKRQQTQKNIISSRDKATFQIKVIKLQKEIQFYKDHNVLLKKQLMDYKSEKQLIQDLRKKISQLEEQKNILEGRVVVMESLSITDRTRVNPQTYNTLKQFQKRIELLTQDSTILKDLQGNHLQQLIAMKAYIMQLDERLKQIGQENQRLLKKYTYGKQKIFNMNIQIKQIQNESKTKSIMYKQKIASYDKLVQKLTFQLQKNLKTVKTKSSSQTQFNQVVNLYQQKMINMGQQIMRIRKDKQNFQKQLKQLRLNLNRKIRQLNDKERDIVILKTENINLQNKSSNLEKEVLQLKLTNQFYQMNKDYKGESLEKSRFIAILQEENRLTRTRYEQQFFKVKETYEEQIHTLRNTIFQLERQINQFKYQNHQAINSSRTQPHNLHHQTSQSNKPSPKPLSDKVKQLQKSLAIKNHELEKITLDFNQNFKALEQQLTLKYQMLLQNQKQYSQQLQQKLNDLKSKNNHKNVRFEQNSIITKYQKELEQKGKEIQELQNVILRNNHQLQEMKNKQKSLDLDKIQQGHGRTESVQEFVQDNRRLSSLNYQLNVKISGLESTIYNLKLDNQRLKSQSEIMEEKLASLETEIKVKKSQIFHLQSQVRSSSNVRDSQIMAKDSLMRSYENQIQNLKYSIDDLKKISKIQKDQYLNRIQQLQNQLNGKNISQSYLYTQDIHNNNNENVNTSPQKQYQQLYQNLQNFNQQLQTQLKNKNNQVIQLNKKIINLQTELKYKKQQLNQKYKVIRQNQNIKSKSPGIQNKPKSSSSGIKEGSNVSEKNSGNQTLLQNEEIQSLNTQILTLRANIITLKDQIEFKQSKISELKHEIYVLKLENKKLERLQSQNNVLKQQLSKNNQKQTIIKQLKQQISHLQTLNQKKQYESSQNVVKPQKIAQHPDSLIINQLNEQIQNLKQIISMNERNLSQQMIEQLERLRRQNKQTQSQRCKEMSYEIEKLQEKLKETKDFYQKQISNLKFIISQQENQLQIRNEKISELTKTLLQSKPSINNKSQNSQTLDLDYLIKEIQRLTFNLKQKEKELEDTKILNQKYQSEKQRYKENLGLICLLMIEVQALRYQLEERNRNGRKELQYLISKLNIKKSNYSNGQSTLNIQKQLNEIHNKLVDYQNYNKSIFKAQNHQSYSHNQENTDNVSLKSQQHSSVLQYNSQSSHFPLNHLYRNAESHYNAFSNNSTKKQPYYGSKFELGSYGKISESHNIESSYNSSSLQNSYQKPNLEGYGYALKNVNMISSVQANNKIYHHQHSQSYPNQNISFSNASSMSYSTEKSLQNKQHLNHGIATFKKIQDKHPGSVGSIQSQMESTYYVKGKN